MVYTQQDGSPWYKDDQTIKVRLWVYCQFVNCESQWCFANVLISLEFMTCLDQAASGAA